MIQIITLLITIISLITPVFALIFLGAALQAGSFFSENFLKEMNQFIYKISLPCLVFYKLIERPISNGLFSTTSILAIGLTLFSILGTWLIASRFSKNEDKAPFAQGCYRSNYAIIGLVLASEFFGQAGLREATILLSLTVPLYNLAAVFLLERYSEKPIKLGLFIISFLKSPITLACFLGLGFSVMELSIPSPLLTSIQFLSQVTLPLALISIGSKLLTGPSLIGTSNKALLCVFIKLIIMPFLFVLAGLIIQVPPLQLGILFLLGASPTSVASYVMTQSYGANDMLIGRVVVLSTLASSISISIGLTILSFLNLIPAFG